MNDSSSEFFHFNQLIMYEILYFLYILCNERGPDVIVIMHRRNYGIIYCFISNKISYDFINYEIYHGYTNIITNNIL